MRSHPLVQGSHMRRHKHEGQPVQWKIRGFLVAPVLFVQVIWESWQPLLGKGICDICVTSGFPPICLVSNLDFPGPLSIYYIYIYIDVAFVQAGFLQHASFTFIILLLGVAMSVIDCNMPRFIFPNTLESAPGILDTSRVGWSWRAKGLRLCLQILLEKDATKTCVAIQLWRRCNIETLPPMRYPKRIHKSGQFSSSQLEHLYNFRSQMSPSKKILGADKPSHVFVFF